MTCSFQKIAESEEEDIQLPERTSPEGQSPFAVASEPPFAERRPASPQKLSPTYARKFPVPRLCHGFLNLKHRQAPTLFGYLSPDRHGVGSDLITLPPIPETASS